MPRPLLQALHTALKALKPLPADVVFAEGMTGGTWREGSTSQQGACGHNESLGAWCVCERTSTRGLVTRSADNYWTMLKTSKFCLAP